MVKITNIPAGEQKGSDFQIKLDGIAAESYVARVSAMPFNRTWPGQQRPLEQTELASIVSFVMDSPVQVELEAQKDFEDVVIRPLSAGICPKTDGRTISFTIEKPGQYMVELDGWHNPLNIYANPDVDFGVSPEDENVIYFPAGVHHAGIIELQSGQTLYIDQDAVVYGSVIAACAKNVKVLGYGILDGSEEKRYTENPLVPVDFRRFPGFEPFVDTLSFLPPAVSQNPPVPSIMLREKEEFMKFLKDANTLYDIVHFYKCDNAVINGPILRDSSNFTVIVANCDNTLIDNVKIIGQWRYNSDGIDLFNSRNCVIRNSFLRDFDDCVVVKGMVGWDSLNNENILVENCVVWCDWGRNLEIGAETVAPEYCNIIFRNCDCIHCAHIALDIQHTNSAYVHDVTFEDIRVEYSKYDVECVYQHSDDMVFPGDHGVPTLIFAGQCNPANFSVDKLNGKMSDITYRNIQILTDNEAELPPIQLRGKDPEHDIRRVLIENITVNGKPACVKEMLHTSEFVSDLVIK